MAVRQSNFEAIGTHWSIQVHDKLSDEAWIDLLQKIYLRIQRFDKTYSRFRPDSFVASIAHASGKHEMPCDGYKLLHFYDQLRKATSGKVTPLIGQTIADAGYDAAYSFTPKELHRPPEWDKTISYTKDALTLHKPALLDFGATGKGYLVDIVGDLVKDAGIGTFTINASGDILHRSETDNNLEVGLENPQDTSEAIGIARLGNKSLCASAGSKRKWKGFHHIIDPDTLQSPDYILATWVIADDTMTADGLATALFFVGPQQLARHFSFSYALLDKDMQLNHAKDFPVTLFGEIV
jgi:thiamine biosynthesis lipoprotein